ncbi:MAG: glycosyltransferase [Candidatus Bathyarchaeia archaeon]
MVSLFLTVFIILLFIALIPYLIRIALFVYSFSITSDATSTKKVTNPPFFPKVSIILPVYNEEKLISRKMNNLLSLSYPKDKVEVIVVDGGSTDKTVKLLEGVEDDRLVLVKNQAREGVTQATKDGVRISTGDVAVLTDTEALFDEDVLLLLAEDLMDPKVGAITGVEQIVNPKENLVTQMEHTHRSLYNTFSISESKVYSTYYFRGEFAAIRRELFPMNVDSRKGILDVCISLSAIRAGYKAKCDPRIKFYCLATNRSDDRNRQKIQRATLNQESMLQNRDLLFTPTPFGRVIFPNTFAIHLVSPLLFLCAVLLIPLVLLELPWQLVALICVFIVAVFLPSKTRNILIAFIQLQLYLLIGLMKATVFGHSRFLKQVKTTRREFDMHSKGV